MIIDIVELEIVKRRSIEIDNCEGYVYGVETAEPIFCTEIGRANIEKVAILCMDSTHKVINFSVVSMGDEKNVKVIVPQLVKTAVVSNASFVILGHNHPSGVLEITSYDEETTKKIASVLHAIGIILIDSIIVNDERALSIREECNNRDGWK